MLFVFQKSMFIAFVITKQNKKVNQVSREEGLGESAETAGDQLRALQMGIRTKSQHWTRKRPRARHAQQERAGLGIWTQAGWWRASQSGRGAQEA